MHKTNTFAQPSSIPHNQLGRRRLPLVLLGNALLRIAGAAGGILIGAIATQLFGLSGVVTVFFLARALEGIAGAAGGPSLLAHLTDVTEGDDALRGRVMSFYELTLLGGFALGSWVGSTLWARLSSGAFSVVALVYVLAAACWAVGAVGSQQHGRSQAWSGLVRAARDPAILRLAPAWLCINAIVGLWLGPTLTFLLTLNERRGQYLTGLFYQQPDQVGLVLLVYALVFAAGVTVWSFFIGRLPRQRILKVALVAMVGVCVGLYLINQSVGWPSEARVLVIVLTALCVMVESGFTPAALSLLADVVGAQSGRGSAMGIYNVLLNLGSLVGSLMGGALAGLFAVNGLIYGTLAMAAIAFVAVQFLPGSPSKSNTTVVLN